MANWRLNKMITEENIRPVPKYMLNRIKKLDKQFNPTPNGKIDFILISPNTKMNYVVLQLRLGINTKIGFANK